VGATIGAVFSGDIAAFLAQNTNLRHFWCNRSATYAANKTR